MAKGGAVRTHGGPYHVGRLLDAPGGHELLLDRRHDLVELVRERRVEHLLARGLLDVRIAELLHLLGVDERLGLAVTHAVGVDAHDGLQRVHEPAVACHSVGREVSKRNGEVAARAHGLVDLGSQRRHCGLQSINESVRLPQVLITHVDIAGAGALAHVLHELVECVRVVRAQHGELRGLDDLRKDLGRSGGKLHLLELLVVL